MAKTTVAPIKITNIDEALAALEEIDEIQAEIADRMKRQVDLKKAATAFAVAKKISVIQGEEKYWRQINRATRFWVGEEADMPDPAPKGAKSLRAICAGLTANVKGKEIPLWNFITKRVPDAEKIDRAVALGFVKESVISKAFIEKPQAPFLQGFQGEADDA